MVDENSGQCPFADQGQAIGVPGGRREDLWAVALCQKGIMVCILGYLLCFLAIAYGMMSQLSVVRQAGQPDVLGYLPGLAVVLLVTELATLLFVVLLAAKLYGAAAGVLFGLLTFIPCVGLLVLLVVNGKATTILRQNGHRVGLLGARLSEFRP
ncbi:MAG: hypothetical protein ABFC96_16270 [Thermoguttaceae bacterium]